jgi:CRISPR-associated endoribonuclease Cas6
MELDMLDSPYSLHLIEIEVVATKTGDLNSSLNRALHAQIINWISTVDENIARQIHNSQVSPLTVSGLLSRSDPNKVQAGREMNFRVGLMDGRILPPLLQALNQVEKDTLYLTEFPFKIKQVLAMPDNNSTAQFSTYEDLAKISQAHDQIELQFLSPTSFKQGSQIIQPFPLPELVFNGLLRRWNVFAPPSLRFQLTEWQGMIAAYDLKTQALKMKADEIGSIGWIRYEFPNPEQARIATILAHFAQFAGIGRKTAMGMGQVRLKKHSHS